MKKSIRERVLEAQEQMLKSEIKYWKLKNKMEDLKIKKLKRRLK